MGEYTLLAVLGDGSIYRISTLEDLLGLIERHGRLKLILVRGDIIGLLNVENISASEGAWAPRQPKTSSSPLRSLVSARGVAVVLDQMFKGFSEIILREVPGVEVHEILGRGIESTLRIGDRLYKHPARDDFDILKLLEELSNSRNIVVFFTGDKKLSSQAMALSRGNLIVEYMPPNEYPGKESLARAMLSTIKSKLTPATEESDTRSTQT